MSEHGGNELLISVSEFETRVALVEAGSACEVHIARSEEDTLVGDVFLGRVERVVPGIDAAFVEIGLERPGFLHVRELQHDAHGAERVDIRDLVSVGQELLVQIAKDPIASKGARLTTQLAIASRYCVLMSFSEHIGISQRIADDPERIRLKNAVELARREHEIEMGVIVRTAAEGAAPTMLAGDIELLLRIWERVLERRAQYTCPFRVYQELPLPIRVVRDLATPSVGKILIDQPDTLARVEEFVEEFLPEFSDRVVPYDGTPPLFERFGIDEEIERALSKRVSLKSGGHLLIEQTDAMITIDVNTGRYLGGASQEETVFLTNMEAAACVPRQLRLRNLGGIIVIDFIDMTDEAHKRQVLSTLQNACEADPAPTRVGEISPLGLVEMSRKRTRESLSQQLCQPCEACAGGGLVKSAQTTCTEVFRTLVEKARGAGEGQTGEFRIRAEGAVAERLLDEEATQLSELSESLGCVVRIQAEPLYGPGQFDVVLVPGDA